MYSYMHARNGLVVRILKEVVKIFEKFVKKVLY